MGCGRHCFKSVTLKNNTYQTQARVHKLRELQFADLTYDKTLNFEHEFLHAINNLNILTSSLHQWEWRLEV